MKALRARRALAALSASKPIHSDINSTFLCRFYAAQLQQATTTSATTSSSSEDGESGDSVFNSRHYELPEAKRDLFGEETQTKPSRIQVKEKGQRQRSAMLAKALLEASMEQSDEDRMVKEEDQMSVSVGIIGAPNAGKSALTNYMVGTKVAAVSRKTNTTTHEVSRMMTKGNTQLSHPLISWENPFTRGLSRHYHDGRPRGSLWRGKKLIGKEALSVILGLKRVKDDEENLNKFIKTHVSRLLKMDMIAVLVELERQEQVALALKIFMVIQKEDWYKPDVFLYKDLIVALAKGGKMDDVMQLWESMKKENLFPDSQTYTEVIRGFLRCGSPADAMNIYEDMKKSPDPPEELPFRILLKGLLPHPLLRNKVKQEFEEIFPDSHMYDPPEEIFGLR